MGYSYVYDATVFVNWGEQRKAAQIDECVPLFGEKIAIFQ